MAVSITVQTSFCVQHIVVVVSKQWVDHSFATGVNLNSRSYTSNEPLMFVVEYRFVLINLYTTQT